MKLTLKDRVLILNSVLPPFDTRRGMELSLSIESKIELSDTENKSVIIQGTGNDQYQIGFTIKRALEDEKEIELTDEELTYLKNKVNFIDRDGRFSAYALPTYVKILDEPLLEPILEEPLPEIPVEEPFQELSVEPLSSGILDESGKVIAKLLPKEVLEEEETYAH
ncbi:MAG: hypothetical protein LUH01_07810 [Parabacteroides gordonii]|nr:hypothetical protein [Parabacteroides gordonii]